VEVKERVGATDGVKGGIYAGGGGCRTREGRVGRATAGVRLRVATF